MGFTGVISSRNLWSYFNLLGTGCLGPTLYHDQPTTSRIICQMAGPLNVSRLWRAVMLAWVSKALGPTSVLDSRISNRGEQKTIQGGEFFLVNEYGLPGSTQMVIWCFLLDGVFF